MCINFCSSHNLHTQQKILKTGAYTFPLMQYVNSFGAKHITIWSYLHLCESKDVHMHGLGETQKTPPHALHAIGSLKLRGRADSLQL